MSQLPLQAAGTASGSVRPRVPATVAVMNWGLILPSRLTEP